MPSPIPIVTSDDFAPRAGALPDGFSIEIVRDLLSGRSSDVSSAFTWASTPQGHTFWRNEGVCVERGGVLSGEARAYLELCVVAACGAHERLLDTTDRAPNLPRFNVRAAMDALSPDRDVAMRGIGSMVRWSSTPQGHDFWDAEQIAVSRGDRSLSLGARQQIEQWIARAAPEPAPEPQQPQLPLGPPARLKRVALKSRIISLPQLGEAVAGCDCMACKNERRVNAPPPTSASLWQRSEEMDAARAEHLAQGRSFGVEIEFLVAPYAHCAYTWVANELKARTGETINTRVGQFSGRKWGVKNDGSLRGLASGQYGVEIASPVLRGEEGLAQVKLVLDTLRAMGGTVNHSCGLHVHVGAKDMSVAERRNLLTNFLRYERFFDLILPASRRTNTYARSARKMLSATRSDDVKAAEHAILRLMAVKDDYELHHLYPGASSGDLHHMKLANALSEWGTFEFRQHSGTLNAEKAINWTRLILAFVERAKDKPAVAFYSRELTPEEEMEKFFAAFKIERGLRAYYRKRHAALYADPNNDA